MTDHNNDCRDRQFKGLIRCIRVRVAKGLSNPNCGDFACEQEHATNVIRQIKLMCDSFHVDLSCRLFWSSITKIKLMGRNFGVDLQQALSGHITGRQAAASIAIYLPSWRSVN